MRRLIPAKLRHFLCDEDGATSIEYALLASGVAGVIVAMVTAMRSRKSPSKSRSASARAATGC